ncbi:MAG: carbon-nitrogen hydrolase family protein [Limnochordales bacterium]|nr:carbon-nitrogen hydrolase family protein [Limnochordales bacterium]
MKQVAAVQARVDVRDYLSEETFRRKIYRLLEQVRDKADPDEKIPLLVAFPEDIGTPCAFLGETELIRREQTLAGAIGYLMRRRFWPALFKRLRHRVGWVRALFLLQADLIARTYISVFARAARDFRAYIVAGSTTLPDLDGNDRAEVYNVAYVFDPHGRVIGRQRKVHLIELEARGLDLSPAPLEQLHPISTSLGEIGVAICYDGFFTDVRNHLRAQGAEILVQPSANPGIWTPEQQLDWLNGAWTATLTEGEESTSRFQLAINPMLVGRLFDLEFQGQSAIIAAHGAQARKAERHLPGYQACPDRPGFLAVAPSPTEECVLVTRIA